MTKTILLTGATGYLGNHLGRKLLQENYSIVALYLNHNENFCYDKQYRGQVQKVYLSDTNINEIFENYKIDGIIHTATLYGRCGENISDIIKSNITFPVDLINEAINYKVKFFINTDTILNKYKNPYSLTKNNFVEWLKMYSNNINIVNVKLDIMYGPNDKNTKFVALMLEKLLNNEAIDLTEGTQTRDFIYIDDIVNAFSIILKNIDKINLEKFSTFEIGTNKKYSIRYVMQTLKELTKSKSILNFGAIPYSKNEFLDYNMNTKNLELLGWKPSVDIKTGLINVVEASKNNGEVK